MTKTEARAYLRRVREGAREAEAALKANDAEALMLAVQEIGGSAGEIESALASVYDVDGEPEGVAGMTVTGR